MFTVLMGMGAVLLYCVQRWLQQAMLTPLKKPFKKYVHCDQGSSSISGKETRCSAGLKGEVNLCEYVQPHIKVTTGNQECSRFDCAV